MTPLPRRQFIQGSALAAALASMAACSTSSGNDDGPVTFEGTGPITWVQGKDNSGGKVQARIDEWNKANPGEKVKLIELSAEADQQRTALVNAARINSNAYDVVSLDNVWVSEFAANRWVVELPEDELKNDDILEPVWKTGVYKDKLFAVPFHTDAPVMFYRKDFLKQAGVAVPKTWEEVKTAIDKVRALPGHENIGGFGGQFAKYEGLTCCTSEFIHTAGGGFYDADNQVIVDSAESVTGLQWLIDGFSQGYIPKESLEWKEEDGRNAFEKGDLLFYRQWPYQYANNKESLGTEKFDVAALPSINGKDFVSTLGGHNCAITKGSKNKATALKFVKWWISEDSQRYQLKTQTLAPILGSLYEDSELLKDFPYLPILKKSLENAKSRPQAVYYGDVTAKIQDSIYPAIQQPGSRAAKDVIASLSSSLKNLEG